MMKRLLFSITLLIFMFLSTSCQTDGNEGESNQNEKPFNIDLKSVQIIEETTQTLDDKSLVPGTGTTKRLELSISITNEQNTAYDNTRFKVALNEEAKNFIASGVVERESDSFYIVPKGAEASKLKNGLIEITGFADIWSPQITSDEDLNEYYNLEFDDISEHIKSYTVTVKWDGGQQVEVLPITLDAITGD